MKFARTRHIARNDARGLETAARAILRGELVAFPTETVYGLGANAFDEAAVRNIFRVKGRPADNPLIVHVASPAQAENLFQTLPRHFEKLAAAFWPGPLSIIGRRNASVPDVVTADLPNVAVRMPDHQLALRLIRAAGVPLVAPSANRSGAPSPTSAADVLEDLGGRIFAVLDGGRCRIGIESTVLDATGKTPRILRPGRIGAEEIAALLGIPVLHARSSHARPSSPGMKYVHYAPEAELILFIGRETEMRQAMGRFLLRARRRGTTCGILAGRKYRTLDPDLFYPLGEGSPVEYARGLYDGMRALDKQEAEVILCPGLPEEGLGLAVMNRLRKAAAKILVCHRKK